MSHTVVGSDASFIDVAYEELFPDVLPENKAEYEESKARAKALFKEGWNVLIERDERGNVVVSKKEYDTEVSNKEN
jgi:hypothetical protein